MERERQMIWQKTGTARCNGCVVKDVWQHIMLARFLLTSSLVSPPLVHWHMSWHHVCHFTTKVWEAPGIPLCCGETELSSLSDYLSLKLSWRCSESGMLGVQLKPKLCLSFCFLPYTLWRTRGTEKQSTHLQKNVMRLSSVVNMCLNNIWLFKDFTKKSLLLIQSITVSSG